MEALGLASAAHLFKLVTPALPRRYAIGRQIWSWSSRWPWKYNEINSQCLLAFIAVLQVRYWKTNLELVKSVAAHREAVRMLAFAPSDLKYATGSDDSTVRVGGWER